MTLILGCGVGIGLVLILSPLLWPVRRQVHVRSRSRLGSLLRDRLVQGGLESVRTPTFVLASILGGLAVGAVTFVLVPVMALAGGAALVALAAPFALVSWKASAQRRASRVVWPDVVDHLVSAVRSGLALPDSLVTLAHGGPVSTRGAFSAFERDYQATGNFSRCLDLLKDRLADPIADRILETLRMSREVGGTELPAVLRGLAAYLRQEAAIRGEVESRQSWVMNAAKLGAAAPWIVLALLASRPEAAAAYNTPAGVTLIVGGLVVTVVAYRAMIALARLPEDRRWSA